ncbi:MAG: hypothetical protein JXX14_05845 [Deltaproteobacteria bacterium]|nr:hypothetical protein [Deltaproteobacteria bacterium]
MRSILALFLGALLLSVLGCKSKSRTENKPPSALLKSEKSEQEHVKQTSFIERVTPLDGVLPASDLKQRQAIRQFYVGMQLRSEGKVEDAIDAFLAALKLDPLHLMARFQLAVTLAQKKDAENALAVLDAFNSAKACPRCYVMLAKAKEHPAFDIFQRHLPFHALVDKPAARYKKQMAEAKWISYDRDALSEKKMRFVFNGIPAVSADGKRILAVNLEENGNGDTIAATLQTFDVETGERRGGKGILFAAEGERLNSGKSYHREIAWILDDRIAHIHDELISESWSPMTLAFEETATASKPCGHTQKADVAGLSVTLSRMTLTITDAEGKKRIEQDAKLWLPRRPEVCATTPMIRRIYTESKHNALLLALAYCSTACQSTKMKWVAVSY